MTPTQTDTVVRLLHDDTTTIDEHTWLTNLDSLRAEPLTDDQAASLAKLAEKYPAKSAKRRRQF